MVTPMIQGNVVFTFHQTVSFSIRCLTGIIILAVLFTGTGCYYVHEGGSLLSHQLRSRPVSACMADSSISGKVKNFFGEVASIRTFAFDSLGLVENKNYTRYVPIDSNYLVAVLSVADSASLKPYRWCYPIFGCFPLRAYHNINDARKAGERFAKKGYEICIGKSDGFSTLGIFSDPLYSFMADYPVFSVARFLLHEQTHATAYFHDVQFSEELATFIGDEGALEFLKIHYGNDSPEYCDALDFLADQKTWIGLLRSLYMTLDTLYRQPIDRSVKIKRKKEVVGAFRTMLHDKYDSLFTTEWYRGLETQSFNNAYLSVRMTYNLDLGLFEELRRRRGGSLRAVVAFAKELKRRRGDPKMALVEELER